MRSAVVLVDATSGATSPNADSVPEAVERLSEAVEDVVVSCPADRAEVVEAKLEGLEYRLATDRVPDGGPVAAIRSGCRMARGRRTYVTTPADTVDPALLSALFEAVDSEGAIARIGGHDQPLVAVYDTAAAIDAAEMTLGMGSRAMTDVLERLDVTVVAEPPATRASEDAAQPTESGST